MLQRAKIYCDLDGVLADFDKRYDEIVGGADKRPSKESDDAFWKPVIDTPNFWLSLDKMPGAMWLWEALCNCDHLTILSSPGNHDTERAKVQKRMWVQNHIDEEANIIFKQSADKALYACPNSILIDDWDKNIKAWKKAGGHAIKHTSAEQTMNELRAIGLW